MQKANAASIPRSERILGRATCLASDVVGDCVRIRAAKLGNIFQVEKVLSTTLIPSPCVGVVRKKYSPTNCVVQFHGPVINVYVGLSVGRVYVVGTDGRPAKQGDVNYPVPGGAERFQQVGVATDIDELLFIPLEVTLGGGAGARYYQQPLIGPINGSNTVFTTAQNFVHGGVFTESLYYNGQLLLEGIGNDYIASESGGPGSGFDMITTLFVTKTGHRLSLDFTPAP